MVCKHFLSITPRFLAGAIHKSYRTVIWNVIKSYEHITPGTCGTAVSVCMSALQESINGFLPVVHACIQCTVHARREYEKAGIWCVLPACCTWYYLRELISVEYKANLGTYMFAFGSLTALRSSEV